MSSPIPWIALCLISMFALIVAEYRKWPAVRAVAKVLASTGFVGAAVAAGALESGSGRWVLVALVLSWWGDLFLLGKSRALFLAGLVAFLAGHVAFCAAFSARGVQWVVLVCALAAAGLPAAGVGRWLFPGLDRGMRGPVVAYIAVISAMVALAVGTVAHAGNVWIAVAALSFYLSDLAVARDRFVASGFGNRAWGLPLYYGAQLLFATSVLR